MFYNKVNRIIMLVLLSATLNSASEAGETSICDKIEYAFLNSPLQIFVDNFHFHYGETLDFGYGLEATTGISNGIAWYPSFLNFGKNFRMAIGDWHFNVIGAVYDTMRVNNSLSLKKPLLVGFLFLNILRTLHFLSFEFFSFVKLKLISIGSIIFWLLNDREQLKTNITQNWCKHSELKHFYLDEANMNSIFFSFAPVIHVDISKLITFFNGDEE